jgi:thiosulfate reductase cytochrome b subunit
VPADAAIDATPIPPPMPVMKRILVKRHSLAVRLTHWINAIALFLMLFSGLQIFNAHPSLYWGQKAVFAAPWLSMDAVDSPAGLKGVTRLGSLKFDTTGVFGASKNQGVMEARGFPAYATIPASRSLAVARRWHLFFAWIFAVNGLIYLISGAISGHLKRDLVPTGKDLGHLGKDIVDHVRLNLPKGWEAARYGVLQKLAYFATALIVLPLIIMTGMTMSPGLNAAFPFLLDLFGGRQSARSIHFICAMLIVVFIVVHLVMVLLAGPFNEIRSMITGRFAIKVDERDVEGPPA